MRVCWIALIIIFLLACTEADKKKPYKPKKYKNHSDTNQNPKQKKYYKKHSPNKTNANKLSQKQNKKQLLNEFMPLDKDNQVEQQSQYRKKIEVQKYQKISQKINQQLKEQDEEIMVGNKNAQGQGQGQQQQEEEEEDQYEKYLQKLEQDLENYDEQEYEQQEDEEDLSNLYSLEQTLKNIQNYIEELKFQFYQWIEDSVRNFIHFSHKTWQFYRYLRHIQSNHQRQVHYQSNYASLNGGAKIIMKSSKKIKYINSILEDSVDKYMYTDDKYPISFIIGLNEEIAIESISIISFEMYSAITRQFSVSGKFALEDKKWVSLGLFTARNQFGTQEFFTERKIVRYIRIRIFSGYGNWSYYTLTQLKIKGKGLFADAFAQITKLKSQENDQDAQTEAQKSKQIEQENLAKEDNICENVFEVQSQEPHESNLISSLMKKLQNLQIKNDGQMKHMTMLEEAVFNMTEKLERKSKEAHDYKQLSRKQRKQSQIMLYVIAVSLFLSMITLISLICLCMFRRSQLTKLRAELEIRRPLQKANSN